MSRNLCTSCLHWLCLVVFLGALFAHAALFHRGCLSPLTSIPLYAPGFQVDAGGMSVQFVPLAGKELRSVAVHANG